MKESVVHPNISITKNGFDSPKSVTVDKRVKDLETKIRSVEQYLFQRDCTEKTWSNYGDFSLVRLQSTVDGIVGLKEVVVSESRILKLLWALLLALGIAVTIFFIYATTSEYFSEPTATKVKFNLSTEYYFPAVALCPYAWMDAEKAAHLGLSMEGFKYSLLYVDSFYPGIRFANFSQARDDFFSFYHSNNFTSLLDYFKTISLDFEVVNSTEAFKNHTNAIKLPDNKIVVEKLFINYEVCYVYTMNNDGRRLYTRTNPHMKFTDKTMGTINMPPGVWIQLVTDWNFMNTVAPPIYLPSGTRNKILVESRHVVTVSSNEHPCKDPETTPITYTSYQCALTCQNQNFKDAINCEIFRTSLVSNPQPPEKYCHTWEKLPNRTMDIGQFKGTAQSNNITKECFKSCPERCDRTMYRPLIQWTVMVDDGKHKKEAVGNDTGKQVSVEVFIDHIANYEGGSVSLLEVSTFSFVTLVGNIGGMLGIFIGATTMTVVQLVGFFVQVVFRKLRVSRRDVRKISSHS